MNIYHFVFVVSISDVQWPDCLQSSANIEWKYRDDMKSEEDSRWRQVSHEFSHYGPGIRYVNILHGGMADDMEEGWFGSRMKDLSVIIRFPLQ